MVLAEANRKMVNASDIEAKVEKDLPNDEVTNNDSGGDKDE